jgi:hypothetical protein
MEDKRNKDGEAEEAEIRQAFEEWFQSLSDEQLKKFSRTAEDFARMHDDAAWHPLPELFSPPGEEKPIFPTAERLRLQFERQVSRLGEDENAQVLEYYHLHRLRKFSVGLWSTC